MTNAILEEDRLYDKIGGWLVLPAFFHPVIGVLVNLKDAFEIFQTFSETLPQLNQSFIFAAGLVGILFAVAWVVSAYLAATLSPLFPKFYIGLALAGVIIPLIILSLVSQVFGAKPTPDDYKDLAKSILAALVWVPYILFSKRVKATFYGIPMPAKFDYKNVGAPLRDFVQENQAVRGLPREPESLTMVQRLGMVLYWTGVGAAAVMVLVGIFALFNAVSDGAFIGGALIVSALFTWLIGRACKYILVGR